MGNIIDYIKWRGDISMLHSPFNEVDNLILSELAYTNMENIVPETGSAGKVTLGDVLDAYTAAGYDQSNVVNDPLPLLKEAASSKRFGGVRLGGFVNEIDAEKQIQFSAVTYYLDDGTVYVAFRGTDNTIVGWREDFNISYLSETPGQSQSVAYLNGLGKTAKKLSVRVGGHSKGGNLAIYASSFCDESVRRRIVTVYSNDGPGFNKSVAESEEYLSILDRVVLIIPESSLIGILLSNKDDKKIVKSSAMGAQQHNPYTWEVLGARFEPADRQSASSLFLDETIKKWLDTLDDTQRATFVSAVFDSLEASGATTLTELNSHKWVSYNAILKAARSLDDSVQKNVMDSLKKLAVISKDALWNEAKRSFDRKRNDGELSTEPEQKS